MRCRGAIAPDGKRLAIHRHDGDGGDIWVVESDRGTMSRLTFDAAQDNSSPIWSPDGNRIVFHSLRNGNVGLYTKLADGTGNEDLLIESGQRKTPMSWSRDDKFIVYWIVDRKTGGDEWVLPLTGDRKPFPILQTAFNESRPQVSPDGKWIAYDSNETGRGEIYIRPFPSGAGKWQVSTSGGTYPTWRRDGKELYFLGTDNVRGLMAAEIRVAGSSIQPGVPQNLFESGYVALSHPAPFRMYTVSADGQRFLISRSASSTADSAPTPITVVVNWTASLKK